MNSGYANGMIKEFQARGLFGPRHIHKLIVKLPFPKYEKGNTAHDELSALGKACARLAANFVRSIAVQDLEPRALGRARATLRDELVSELEKIDVLASAAAVVVIVQHAGIANKHERQNLVAASAYGQTYSDFSPSALFVASSRSLSRRSSSAFTT
jgi:hypothetical protein